MDHALERPAAVDALHVRRIEPAWPLQWLRSGYADFKQSGGPSLVDASLRLTRGADFRLTLPTQASFELWRGQLTSGAGQLYVGRTFQRGARQRRRQHHWASPSGCKPVEARSRIQDCDIDDKDFGSTVARVTEALKTEGFGVWTEIDVHATMKARLGVKGRSFRFLGASNPPLAHRAGGAEPDIGPLLPCSVVVREEPDGRLLAAFVDTVAVLQMTSNAEVAAVAHEVHELMQRVKALLIAPSAASPED